MEAITREELLLSGRYVEPITRRELFLAKVMGFAVATPEPITREEKLLAGYPLEPITRREMFLAKLAGMAVTLPEPITREEMFLKNAVAGGGGGGEEPVYHTVKFYNGDVLLDSVQVLHSMSASYTGSEPTKESTDQYSYTFSGWSKTKGGAASDDALKNVTSNRSVYAAFVSAVRSYQLHFYNDDGTELLYTANVAYGADGMYVGAEPTKESTAQYDYDFAGWSKTPGGSADNDAIANVTGDRNVYAAFNSTVRSYTVRFWNETTLLQTVTVPYGGSASYTGDEPTKDGDYAFNGWNPSPTNVTADMDCYAQFRSTAIVSRKLVEHTLSGDYVNDRVDEIGHYAFYKCSLLTSVTFPNATVIENYSHQHCSSLARVDLAAVTVIGAGSFRNCSKLDAFIVRNTTRVVTLGNTNVFQSTKIASGNGYIYVPSALVDSYKTNSVWGTYANQIRAIEDYPEICGGEG